MFFVEVSREEVFLFEVRDSLSEPEEEQKIDCQFRFSSALKTQKEQLLSKCWQLTQL
jgi:hypothetical protein